MYRQFFTFLLTVGATVFSYAQSNDIEQDLYLDIILNQAKQSEIGHFIETSEHDILIDRATLNALKLKTLASDEINHTQFINLKNIKGLNFKYNPQEQNIDLTVDVDLLSENKLIQGYEAIEPAIIQREQIQSGTSLNYDLYTQYSSSGMSLNGWNELRFFGLKDGGVFSITGSYSYNKLQDKTSIKGNLLDTYWEQDFPKHAISMTIGDSQSRALTWSRSTRITGLKISKNFSLQPYQNISPLETFKGSTVLPSSVDLWINGIKQSSSQVSPGKFAIQTIPTLTGAGQAELVITDLNGEQRVINFDLFGSARLLKQNFSDWTINLGVSKLDYAINSFKYKDEPVINASYRYGLNQETTLESHAEFTPKLKLLGIGAIKKLPWQTGIFTSSYSYSELSKEKGYLYNIGYEWSNRKLNFSFNHQQTQGQFSDIGTTLGNSYIKRADQAFLGINTGYGQLGTSYALQKSSGIENNYLIMNWSKVFRGQRYLNLSWTRDLNQNQNTFYLSLNFPIDRQVNGSFYAQQDDSRKISGTLRRTAMQDQDDWGWQVNTDLNDQKSYNFYTQVQKYNRYGEWEAGFQRTQNAGINDNIGILAGHGSMLLMKNNIFFTKQSLGAFALVSTDGLSDIPVSLENRTIGKTNKNGLLLVDYLNPYQHNQIAINALNLPIEYKIEKTKVDAVPYQRSGLFIHFPIYKVKFLQLQAVDINGKNLDMGRNVWNQDHIPHSQEKEDTIVGRDGVVYIEEPKNNEIYIGQDEVFCKIKLPDFSKKSGVIDLGIQICQ